MSKIIINAWVDKEEVMEFVDDMESRLLSRGHSIEYNLSLRKEKPTRSNKEEGHDAAPKTAEEKIAFRKEWDARVDRGKG